MTFEEAQDAQMRSRPTDEHYQKCIERIDVPLMKILHATLGLAGEVGEIVDTIKKHIIYGKPLDRPNLFEEGGDLSWYLRLLAESLSDLAKGNCSFEQMIVENVDKLKKRYPEKFTEAAAIARADKQNG